MAPESFPGWKSQKMEVWLVPIFVSCSKRVGDFQVISAVGGFRVENQPCQSSLARIIFINLFPKETSAKDESKGQVDSQEPMV